MEAWHGQEGMGKAAGKGYKEDQSVVGCCNCFFPYSHSTVLGSRHRRNSSPSLFLLFLQPRSFCLWQELTTNTLGIKHFFNFSALRIFAPQLAETMLTAQTSALACVSRYRGSLYSCSANVSFSWCWARHGQKAQQRVPSRMGTISWTPISSWTYMHENKLLTNYLGAELERSVNVLTVTFLYEEHGW